MSIRVRRDVMAALAAFAVAVGLSLAVVPAAAADEGKAPTTCSASIVGQKASGELQLSPVTCGEQSPLARLSVIAIHYTNVNFGGASLSIQGGVCNGGWLNLPPGWVNTVSSTWSVCNTTHYDLYYLTGDSETLPAGGGNLSALHDRTNSVRYT